MRRQYRQVKTDKGLELVEITPNRVLESLGPMVMGDIKPYKAVAGDMDGKWITSRSQHKAFLKRNGFEEVGNEKRYMQAERARHIKEIEDRSAKQRTEAIRKTLNAYRID